MPNSTQRQRTTLVAVIVIAFGCRVAAKVVFSDERMFWRDAYREYYNIAHSLKNGKGFCTRLNNNALEHAGIDQAILGAGCAHLPPGYPLFLALVASMPEGPEKQKARDKFILTALLTGGIMAMALKGSMAA